jgi:hypothetical protein
MTCRDLRFRAIGAARPSLFLALHVALALTICGSAWATTPTIPPPTPTPTSTPPTPPCVGDCNTDGAVTIDELILGVNITLGITYIGACPNLAESLCLGLECFPLMVAVNNALHGCPTPAPTPTLPHGRTCCECADAACRDFTWVEVEPTCPLGCQTFSDAACEEADCHGGPSTGPITCVALTPCTTDAECDDGNGCTADQCTTDGCTHACVCD